MVDAPVSALAPLPQPPPGPDDVVTVKVGGKAGDDLTRCQKSTEWNVERLESNRRATQSLAAFQVVTPSVFEGVWQAPVGAILGLALPY